MSDATLLLVLLRSLAVAAILAGGAFSAQAIAFAPVTAAACNGWISTDSSGSSPKIGHQAQDSSTGSTTWSDGDVRIKLPSSFYCKSWLRTYVYDGFATGQAGTDWRGNYYWVPMNPSGSSSNCTFAGTTNANNSGITDYMKQYTSSCGNAAFPVAANATSLGVSENTTYTNWGIGYASCTTYYSAQTVITQNSSAGSPASPGANCGTPAWRAPDLQMTVPKFDWHPPTTDFSTPNEGTTSAQSSTSVTATWSETETGGSTLSTRSLQRQRGAVVTNGTCTGVTWANDGSPSTSVSPVTASGLLSGYCYQWIQTLTDVAGNQTITPSGAVIIDTAGPTTTITYPDANRSLAGTVAITGTATDATSFASYDVEAGAGTSPSSWSPIAMAQTAQVSSGTLATWTSYPSQGVYTIRLTVRDMAGNTNTSTKLVYVENSRRGEESYRTRVPFDLGGGWRIAVGVTNGELTLDRQLFTIPSYGPPQSLALHYSSQISDGAGMFGTGWTSDLTQFLSFESGFVVWHRPDGGLVPFGQVTGVWTALAGHYETLTYDSGTNRYTVTAKDQSKLIFSGTAPGRLVSMNNRFGKALSFVWNSGSATATDASGRATTLTISGGNITGATDSAGRSWAFGYTGSNMTTVADPASKATALAYTSGLLTSLSRQRTPASGPVQTVQWTVGYTSGKATSVTDPVNASASNTISYGTGSTTVNLLKTYGPTYNNWTYTFDSLGRVTRATDPLNFNTDATFDANSNLTSLVLPIATGTTQTISYTYDTRGNVLSQTTQLSATDSDVTVLSYNTTNDILTRTEGDNDATKKRVTLFTYDGAGHLTASDVNCTTTGTTPPTDASTCTGAGTQDAATNLLTTFTYTSNDQLDSETDPLGRVTKHAYDSSGNETSTTTNYVSGGGSTADQNVVTSWAYDQQTVAGKAGMPTSTTDAVGNATAYSYDALGRQTAEVLPGDASIAVLTRSTTYDELGNVLTETESYSGSSRATTHVYDLADRETSVTDPAGNATSTAYDAAGKCCDDRRRRRHHREHL